jgi:predicted hotdog family 3-hydroxylacyl-ACP dehydratase
LPAVHAFEYGGQAAAVHGGLLARLAGEQARFAYLGALKAAMLYVSRLDDIEGELRVFAELLMGDRVAPSINVGSKAPVGVSPRCGSLSSS